jgi:heme exporter protein D
MAFDSFAELMNMGGHGQYVWSTYLIGFAIIAYNVISPIVLRNKLVKENQRRLRREQS